MPGAEHWSRLREASGAVVGIRLLMWIYEHGGRIPFSLVLRCVMFCYWLCSSRARRASRQFLDAANTRRAELGMPKFKESTYRHFVSFAEMILDKLRAWRRDPSFERSVGFIGTSREVINDFSEGGKLLIVSHLGNAGALRAEGTEGRMADITALAFTAHAGKFNEVYKALAPDSALNIIAVQAIDPGTALALKEKIAKGGVVAIAGDRTPPGASRGAEHVVWVDFMGRKAPLPAGPFILAGLLGCRADAAFALKGDDGRLGTACTRLRGPGRVTRGSRDAAASELAQDYARLLERYALEYPYQWFNFFDFFRK